MRLLIPLVALSLFAPWSASAQDGDGILGFADNCPNDPNPGQDDLDLDLLGDVCDPFPFDRDNEQAQCEADLAQCQNECLGPETDCRDGIDNDGDGKIDFPADQQCASGEDASELVFLIQRDSFCAVGFEGMLGLVPLAAVRRRWRTN